MFCLNGRLLQEEPYDSSIFYGKSLFETIAIINGKTLFLKEHLERLRKSADVLGILVVADIEKQVEDFVAKYGFFEEGMLKLQISEKDLYMKILPFELRDFPSGIKAGFIKEYYQNELGMHKSGNYLTNILARDIVLKKGCFEGIFLNRLGQVTEGTISNLFFIKGSKLKTPHLELNILPGITRNKIINIAKELKIEVQEGFFGPDEVMDADSVFFTNSLVKKGLVWVSELEEKSYKKDEIVHNIENKYFKIQNTMV